MYIFYIFHITYPLFVILYGGANILPILFEGVANVLPLVLRRVNVRGDVLPLVLRRGKCPGNVRLPFSTKVLTRRSKDRLMT